MTIVFIKVELLFFSFNSGLGHIVNTNGSLGGHLLPFLIINTALNTRNQVFKLIILILLELPLDHLLKPLVELTWTVGALREIEIILIIRTLPLLRRLLDTLINVAFPHLRYRKSVLRWVDVHSIILCWHIRTRLKMVVRLSSLSFMPGTDWL